MNARLPAVVIGGASGIGAAVVQKMRAGGSDVVVWDVAGRVDVACDITDAEQVAAATSATVDLVGAPATVTITAGIGHSGYLLDAAPEEWDRVMNVNTKGPWLAMRALASVMLGAEGGSIVATGSVSSRLADKTMGLYCASKAALDMVVKVAALEWAPSVRVNAVAPGVTDTAMLGRAPRTGPWLSAVAHRTALGRLGQPDDIAETILALHAMDWVTGQVVECDGGLGLWSPITSAT
jgi:NAD(P)-dependent dehydrogenase (short-subunit alcohol dehydrogenase family)